VKIYTLYFVFGESLLTVTEIRIVLLHVLHKLYVISALFLNFDIILWRPWYSFFLTFFNACRNRICNRCKKVCCNLSGPTKKIQVFKIDFGVFNFTEKYLMITIEDSVKTLNKVEV
jgi:hypothetical protein